MLPGAMSMRLAKITPSGTSLPLRLFARRADRAASPPMASSWTGRDSWPVAPTTLRASLFVAMGQLSGNGGTARARRESVLTPAASSAGSGRCWRRGLHPASEGRVCQPR